MRRCTGAAWAISAMVKHDMEGKEFIYSPRLMWLAEEAQRGRYLIFRDNEMGLEPFPAATLEPLLDHVFALSQYRATATPETAP